LNREKEGGNCRRLCGFDSHPAARHFNGQPLAALYRPGDGFVIHSESGRNLVDPFPLHGFADKFHRCLVGADAVRHEDQISRSRVVVDRARLMKMGVHSAAQLAQLLMRIERDGA
jgi:hypothetical protein